MAFSDYTTKAKRQTMRIKTAFVSSILKDTAEKIYAEQSQAADDWNLFKSGRLKSELQGHFTLSNNEGGAGVSMRYLKYFRWLDMQDPRRKIKKEGYHAYNRILFGNIYLYGIPRIQWNFTDQVKAEFAQKILEVEQSKYPYGKKIAMQLELVSTEIDPNLAAIIAKSLRMGYR